MRKYTIKIIILFFRKRSIAYKNFIFHFQLIFSFKIIRKVDISMRKQLYENFFKKHK